MCNKVITFASGNNCYYEAAKRLINQAESTSLFECELITENCLKSDNEFWDKHSNFIEKNKRGFGYWIWKPYIIKKTMQTLNTGDVLLYLDSGCEIDINKKRQIEEYLELVKKKIILI